MLPFPKVGEVFVLDGWDELEGKKAFRLVDIGFLMSVPAVREALAGYVTPDYQQAWLEAFRLAYNPGEKVYASVNILRPEPRGFYSIEWSPGGSPSNYRCHPPDVTHIDGLWLVEANDSPVAPEPSL
ncbi:MAG: hypothetical protein WCV86_01900 [Patescibacteria group bacterium]|jgi:hypothetical protein